MDDSIQRYPLLRLLVAYLLGVGMAHAVYPVADTKMLSWMMLLGAVLMMSIVAVCVVVNRGTKMLFGVSASLVFMFLGAIGYIHERQNNVYEWSPKEVVYKAHLVDSPRNRERSVLCVVSIDAVCDSAVWHGVPHGALL